MAMDVGGAITPAINHTQRVLFQPFALRKWLALGFVSMFAGAGGGGSGGSSHYGNNTSNFKHSAGPMFKDASAWVNAHIALIIAGVLVLIAVSVFFAWLSSVLKFVYLNQITRSPAAIREPFHRMMGLGTSFFLWRIGFGLVVTLAGLILIGLPVLLAFAGGGNAAEVISIIWAVPVGLMLVLFASVTEIFARDFVSATMFVREIKVMDAWRVVLPILKANAGQSALYVLFLIVIAIVTGIGGMVAAIAVGLAFLIPGGLLALIGYGIWSACHCWSAGLIVYSALIGIPLLFAIGYAMSCLMQPFQVFRRTYALVVLGQAEPSLRTIEAA